MNFKVSRAGALLLGVLLLGTLLRLFRLGSESIWGDEGFSIRLAGMDLPRLISHGSSDPTPPLYYALLHYWTGFLGSSSEVSARLLSVVFGSLAVLLTYKVGSALFERSTGLMAAFIAALSTFQIEYSQTVRAYGLMLFLALLSFYFFVRLLSEGRPLLYVTYVLATSLLLYSHAYGLFVVIAQGLYFLLAHAGRRGGAALSFGRWFLLQVALAVLYVPAAFQLAVQALHGQHLGWVPKPPNTAVLASFVSYSGSLPLLVLFLALSAVAVVALAKSGPNKLLLLALWLAVPVVVPFVVSSFLVPLYVTRDTIAASPAFYLLAARGAQVLSTRSAGRSGGSEKGFSGKSVVSVLPAAAAVAVLSLPVLWVYFATPGEDQWRAAATYVDSHALSGDLVVVTPGPNLINAFDYYSKRQDLKKLPFPKKGRPDITKQSVKALGSALNNQPRVWLVLDKNAGHPDLLKRALAKHYALVLRNKYRGLQLILYERRAPNPLGAERNLRKVRPLADLPRRV